MSETKKENKEEKYEMLLDPKYDRLTIEPIQFPDIYKMYKLHENAIWHKKDIEREITHDKEKWDKLTKDEKYFLTHVLSFFGISDSLVSDNIIFNFAQKIQIPEVKFFYCFQSVIENTHNEVYSLLLSTYITDQKELKKCFNAVQTMPSIGAKRKWGEQWLDPKHSLATQLVAFSIFEGIMFSGSFCAIYWLSERKMITGLSKSNEYIARDEGIHVSFGALLYTKYIQNKLTDEEFEKMLRSATECEINFVEKALPVKLVGMNSNDMSNYIRFCANRLAVQMGHKKIFFGGKNGKGEKDGKSEKKEIKNPFPFMDKICLKELSNFFEEHSASYKKFSTTKEEEDAFADI